MCYVQPLGLVHGGPWRGRPVAHGCRVQSSNGGGALYMSDGTVTFKGNSSISRTSAVRFAQRTRALRPTPARACTRRHRKARALAHARTITPKGKHACLLTHTNTPFSHKQANTHTCTHTCTHLRAHTRKPTRVRARTHTHTSTQAAARVQARNGGAVAVSTGTLVFDGVAISDTEAVQPLRRAWRAR